MSLSGNVVFGNATIAATAIQKAANRINENMLLLQGLSNVMDSSGNITDLVSGASGNSQTLLDSIGQMLTSLAARGWVQINGTTATADANGSSVPQVQVRFRVPYNNTLQSATTMNIYTILLPVDLYMASSASLSATTTYNAGNTSSTISSGWGTNVLSEIADNSSAYVTDLVNMQVAFANLNDIMTALGVINQ